MKSVQIPDVRKKEMMKLVKWLYAWFFSQDIFYYLYSLNYSWFIVFIAIDIPEG